MPCNQNGKLEFKNLGKKFLRFLTFPKFPSFRTSQANYSWLHVIVMSRTSFRVNPHSIVCLNVKQLLAPSRRHIWILSDSNKIRTHNHLVHKWTLNHLAKMAFNGWVFVYEPSEFESRCCQVTFVIAFLISRRLLFQRPFEFKPNEDCWRL